MTKDYNFTFCMLHNVVTLLTLLHMFFPIAISILDLIPQESELDVVHCMMYKQKEIMVESHSFGPPDDGVIFAEFSRV